MTCVIGIAKNNHVWIGADSAAVDSSNYAIRTIVAPKVFKRKNLLFGFADSFRMGDLLRHVLEIPTHKPLVSNREYLVTELIPSVRRSFEDHGFLRREETDEQYGGQFMIGYQGVLYTVYPDFHLSEYEEHFDAIGVGADFAIGALASYDAGAPDLSPAVRIESALHIAAKYCAAVRAPFVVEVL